MMKKRQVSKIIDVRDEDFKAKLLKELIAALLEPIHLVNIMMNVCLICK